MSLENLRQESNDNPEADILTGLWNFLCTADGTVSLCVEASLVPFHSFQARLLAISEHICEA